MRRSFEAIEDRRRQASIRFSLPDTLLSALAMFQFKSPSLLHFDEAARGGIRGVRFVNALALNAANADVSDSVVTFARNVVLTARIESRNVVRKRRRLRFDRSMNAIHYT